jgi:hypothetical protein
MIEHRSAVRHKSFIQGRIYFNHRQSSMDCIVREFTGSGARLEFSEMPALPDAFEVFIPTKDEYFRARTVWHKSYLVGVAWTEEGALIPHGDSDLVGDPLEDRITKLEHEVALLRRKIGTLQK